MGDWYSDLNKVLPEYALYYECLLAAMDSTDVYRDQMPTRLKFTSKVPPGQLAYFAYEITVGFMQAHQHLTRQWKAMEALGARVMEVHREFISKKSLDRIEESFGFRAQVDTIRIPIKRRTRKGVPHGDLVMVIEGKEIAIPASQGLCRYETVEGMEMTVSEIIIDTAAVVEAIANPPGKNGIRVNDLSYRATLEYLRSAEGADMTLAYLILNSNVQLQSPVEHKKFALLSLMCRYVEELLKLPAPPDISWLPKRDEPLDPESLRVTVNRHLRNSNFVTDMKNLWAEQYFLEDFDALP